MKACDRSGEIFSQSSNECVPGFETSECQFNHTALNVAHDDSEFSCNSRKDGFYQHPTECHRILQCFGGELFEHPSCEHDLGFDELRVTCDYRHNVPGCVLRDPPTSEASSSGCDGHEHGAHIANEQDCGSFYRCVWGRKELMTCPQGTVFNPDLSVCDFPNSGRNCPSV